MQGRPSELQNQWTVEHRFIQQLDGQLLFAYSLAGRCTPTGGARPLPWPSNRHFTQVLQRRRLQTRRAHSLWGSLQQDSSTPLLDSLQRLSSTGLTSTPLFNRTQITPQLQLTTSPNAFTFANETNGAFSKTAGFRGKGPKNRGSRSPYPIYP